MNKCDFEIAIIGAGKLAHSFVPELVKTGFLVKIIVDTNLSNCKTLAEICGIKSYSSKIADIPQSVNVIFFSVPDDKIKFTAAQVLKEFKFTKPVIFCHFSGAKTADEFNLPKETAISPASLHVLQTFPTLYPKKIKGCYAAVEIESFEAKKKILFICKQLKLNSFEISNKDKPFYHLLGVFGSNFLVSNFAAAESISQKISNPLPAVNVLLKQIAEQTLNNIFSDGIEHSLSGPVERADSSTIAVHLSSLKNAGIEERLIYLSSSLQAIKIAIAKHPEKIAEYSKIKIELIKELKLVIEKI